MTPDYAAPEQVRGEAITARTDVYQLGAVLYELLTGRTPFRGTGRTLHDLEMAALKREPDSLARAFGPDLDAIVRKALSKMPDERYASATDLAQDIRRHLDGHPVRARRQTSAYRARRFVVRHRRQIAGAAVIAFAAGAVAVAVTLSAARESAELTSARELTRGLVALLDSTPAGASFDSAAARRLTNRVASVAQRVVNEPAARAALLEAAGRTYVRLGDEERAFALLQEALIVRTRPDEASRPVIALASPVSPVAPARLLFNRPGDVYMMDADGTNEVRITNSPQAWNEAPAWAPDGKRILLSRDVAGARAIFVVNPDSGDMYQLTAPPPGWHDAIPVALANGVVFKRSDPGGRSGIYRIDLDGTGLRQLTPGPRDEDAAPSSRGDFLVYRRANDIALLDLRTGTVRQLTNTPTVYKAGLAVSPDGTKIAFTRTDPGRLEQIFVMDVDGGNVRRVSRGDDYDYLPRWSPDGERIVFTSHRDGSSGIYSMRIDGSDVRDLSRTPGRLAMQPGWSVLQISETLWAWMKY
jgi:hypothetical protein